jgi:putative hydrolase of the HAD superfamily
LGVGQALSELKAIFWDVGGVLLTNAWDHEQRAQALQKFGLEEADFRKRHENFVVPLEKGEISLDEYLEQTIFYRPRSFAKDVFREYMFSLSQPKLESLQFARKLASTTDCLMGTINNESKELNEYRIRSYGLDQIFTLFVSSCYVGLRKPDAAIYNLALALTQLRAEDCAFIDDREPNVTAAAQVGMHAIRMENVDQVSRELEKLGTAC